MTSFIVGLIIIFVLTFIFYEMGKISAFIRLFAYITMIGSSVFIALQTDNLILSIIICLIFGMFPLILLILKIVEIIKLIVEKSKTKNNRG